MDEIIEAPVEETLEPVGEEVTETPEEQLDEIIPQEYKDALISLLQQCELEDQDAYLALLAKARRLDLYFNNLVTLFWDATSRDWRVPDWNEFDLEGDEEFGLPPRLVPIYRAHAEAIIAALSVNVPGTVFFPDDADNADDLETSEQYSAAAILLERHVNASVKFMKALMIYFNQGVVFGYNYYRRDKKFGFYRKPTYGEINVNLYTAQCPQCGFEFGETENETPTPTVCPNCGNQVLPEITPESERLTVETGFVEQAKGREFLEFYGSLNVKAPLFATEQANVGYLILKFDQSVALLRSLFTVPGPNGEPPVLEEIQPRTSDNTIDDSFSRYSPIYLGSSPSNTAVVKCAWFRPWQFHLLEDKEHIKYFQENYPTGCYVIYVNDQVAEVSEEDMDEHWTITPNPLSQSIFGEPLGTNLASIQDIRAELGELELQTAEHGISETFFETEVIDEDQYKKTMAQPGQKIPVKKNPGEKIGDSFFQTRPATLSQELPVLKKSYDQDAQFVTGSFPSVYGGAMESGSQTASEYNQSRAQALQRLGITWRVISEFWSQVVYKGVREFLNEIETDESFPMKEGKAFRNVYIRRGSLRGKIGSVEPENADQLPVNWGQIKDTLVNLIGMKNPIIESVIFHPQNSALVKKAIGIPELYIPGEPDRTRQYQEIIELLNSEPIMGQMGPESSVPISEEDDDLVHIAICKTFLTSSRGLEEKKNSPAGFQNIVLHMNAHEQRNIMRTMQQNTTPPGESPDSAQPNQLT